MIKRFKHLGISTFLILIQLVSYSQKSPVKVLTFSEAYTQMNGNSYVLKRADYAISEKESDRKAMFGLHAPRVFVSANAIQMADPLTLDLTPVLDAINPLYSALGNYGNFIAQYWPNANHPEPVWVKRKPIC